MPTSASSSAAITSRAASFPALEALAEGYGVYIVTDASGMAVDYAYTMVHKAPQRQA
jgi:hypothetical protein